MCCVGPFFVYLDTGKNGSAPIVDSISLRSRREGSILRLLLKTKPTVIVERLIMKRLQNVMLFLHEVCLFCDFNLIRIEIAHPCLVV